MVSKKNIFGWATARFLDLTPCNGGMRSSWAREEFMASVPSRAFVIEWAGHAKPHVPRGARSLEDKAIALRLLCRDSLR